MQNSNQLFEWSLTIGRSAAIQSFFVCLNDFELFGNLLKFRVDLQRILIDPIKGIQVRVEDFDDLVDLQKNLT